MKHKFSILLAVVISVLSFSSCSVTLPTRFDSLANNVEKNGDDYTLRKWERKNNKFKGLCTEYKGNYDRLNRSQRTRIYSDMATYVKSAAKAGVVTATDAVSELSKQVSGMLDEGKALLESLNLNKNKKKDQPAPPTR